MNGKKQGVGQTGHPEHFESVEQEPLQGIKDFAEGVAGHCSRRRTLITPLISSVRKAKKRERELDVRSRQSQEVH